MSTFNLYSTLGCHLCEDVEQMLLYLTESRQGFTGLVYQVVDIVDDESLYKEYCHSIPVLEHLSSKQKLFYPFDIERLAEWLNHVTE